MKMLIVCFLLACTTFGHTQSPLVGTWQFDIAASLISDSQVKARFDSLPSGSKSRVSERFESRLFDFRPDGTFVASWQQSGGDKNVAGMYSFDSIAQTLTIEISGRVARFSVLTLSNSQLILEDFGKNGLFHRLYFNKHIN